MPPYRVRCRPRTETGQAYRGPREQHGTDPVFVGTGRHDDGYSLRSYQPKLVRFLKRSRVHCVINGEQDHIQGPGKESIMGFIRQQEERLAARYLKWQYEKTNDAVPEDSALETQAAKIVDEAHRIAKETGGNVAGVIKEMIQGAKKK